MWRKKLHPLRAASETIFSSRSNLTPGNVYSVSSEKEATAQRTLSWTVNHTAKGL
jgi:hypothetical protein